MYQKFCAIKRAGSTLLTILLLAGCAPADQTAPSSSQAPSAPAAQTGKSLQYRVDPETFSLDLFSGDTAVPVSLPGPARAVENLSQNEKETAWEYPDEQVSVRVETEADSLLVTVTSLAESDLTFAWPYVNGEQYYLPIGEGKRIAREDVPWSNYLKGKELSAMEQLSMPFWAAVHGDLAVLVVLENPFRSNLVFSEESAIGFHLEHRYPQIDLEKSNRFRIYLTDNNPVSVAKRYRRYVTDQGKFVSLKQKAAQNADIEKLYGAPHIYLWGDNLLTPEDVNWSAFRSAVSSPEMQWVLSLGADEESAQVVKKISSQDYIDNYQQNVICRLLSDALKREDFYSSEKLPEQDETVKALLAKGSDALSPTDRLQLHKHALAANFPGVFQPVENWMNSDTVDLLADMKAAGIEKAWIGLNSWEQAYAKPELVEMAAKEGYLIASYDSYHSIHAPGAEQWNTAQFEDTALYEDATVLNQNGEKAAGFQNVGRKLNPTLSMPAVQQRLEKIMGTGLPFNSWFIDCDATGEIYDDYSPSHKTTQQQDLTARLERMAYARDEYGLVIGSEGGNDFAASTIAFAHGIELPTFSWMDADMKSNKESPYYIGGYYNPTGGVAAHFAKQIPVKEEFYPIFLDPRYDLPLFKLVYNDSVITGYHWDWSTFKIEGAVQDRMIREVLYNTPPLYHLDRDEWETYKDDLAAHNRVWASFSAQAIQQEMTGFSYLNEDGSVQRTEYGEGLSAVANFGDAPYSDGGTEIPAHSALLKMGTESVLYTPSSKERS